MGAKRFGGKAHRGKTALVMIGEPYRLPVYLSDLGGNDSHAHRGRPEEVVRIVRGHLHTRPDGTSLPGAARILETFDRFKTSLPEMAAMLGIARHEIDPYRDYRVYMELLTEFLRLA